MQSPERELEKSVMWLAIPILLTVIGGIGGFMIGVIAVLLKAAWELSGG